MTAPQIIREFQKLSIQQRNETLSILLAEDTGDEVERTLRVCISRLPRHRVKALADIAKEWAKDYQDC